MTEVWYHGRGHGAGPRPIVIENAQGQMAGVLRHVVRHSPTGLSWGYAGSGPADTARSLLVAALGDAAFCTSCRGSRKVVYDEREYDASGAVWSFDPDDAAEYEAKGLTVSSCWDPECDGGYRQLPYQDFKFEFVARWGEEWRMSRADILAWLAKRGIQP